MTIVEELISKIDLTKKNPNKKELWDIIEQTLVLLNRINEDYKKFYEQDGENPALLTEVEKNLEDVKNKYAEYFVSQDGEGKTKLAVLDEKIAVMKQYHKELLESSEEKKSIKADIEDYQKHITEFYNFLVDKKEGGESKEEEAKKYIAEISEFYEKLSNTENGIKNEIEEIYDNMTEKYSDLFDSEKDKLSKIDELENNISNIKTFNTSLEEDIKVKLDKKQKYLGIVKVEIDTIKEDIQDLLSSTTLQTLAQGYQESKEEYSVKKIKTYKNFKTSKKNIDKILHYVYIAPHSLYVFLHNILFRHLDNLLNYIVFIFPLSIILILFIQPNWEILENFNKIFKDLNGSDFENSILFRVALSMPLVWISWFGQKNISQRKRLHEEYNHKLRVVQMYRMFNDDSKSYNITNKVKLEKILLEVIEKNPGVYLGRGETIIDQILEKFKIKGFCNELKEEVIGELKPVIKAMLTDSKKDVTDKE